jgi:hypothetical protein
MDALVLDPRSGTSQPHWSATIRSPSVLRTIRSTSSSKKKSAVKHGGVNGIGRK